MGGLQASKNSFSLYSKKPFTRHAFAIFASADGERLPALEGLRRRREVEPKGGTFSTANPHGGLAGPSFSPQQAC